MSHHPVLPPSARAQRTDSTILSSPPITRAPSALEAHRRVLFAQRLAVLITRIRQAKQEDRADER